MRGTGEGQKVKGHKWERTMPAKLEARRKAMEGMPELIRQWKQVSLSVTLSGKGVLYADRIDRWVMEKDGRSIQDNLHYITHYPHSWLFSYLFHSYVKESAPSGSAS